MGNHCASSSDAVANFSKRSSSSSKAIRDNSGVTVATTKNTELFDDPENESTGTPSVDISSSLGSRNIVTYKSVSEQKKMSDASSLLERSLRSSPDTPYSTDAATTFVATENEKIIELWLTYFTSGKFNMLRTLASPTCTCVFTGGDTEMLLSEFIEALTLVQASFPDFCLTYDSLKEETPGVVIVKNSRVRGTHTGAPFSFGPYPALPAKGRKACDPPIDITFDCHDGNVTKMICNSYGKPNGPPHFYNEIGGITF